MKNNQRKTILIVDDEVDIRETIAETMSEYYKVYFARDGAEALLLMEKHPVDVVVLDIMMPQMNGIEVCRRLKANPATRDIPIIIVTAYNETSRRIEAFKLGVDDFLEKPFRLDELLTRVQARLEKISPAARVKTTRLPRK